MEKIQWDEFEPVDDVSQPDTVEPIGAAATEPDTNWDDFEPVDWAAYEPVEEVAKPIEPQTDDLGQSLTKVIQNTPERWQRRAGGLMAMTGDDTTSVQSIAGPLLEKAAEGEEPGFMDYVDMWHKSVLTLPSMLMRKQVDPGSLGGQAKEWISKKGREIAADAQVEIQANQANPDNPVTQFAVDVARGTIDMGPMLTAGFLTRSPGAFNTIINPGSMGVMSAQVAGETYVDRLDKDKTPAEAMDAVKFNIVAEALPEQIPVAALLKKGTPFLKRFINSALGEGVQETITAILQDTYDNVTLENMSLKEALMSLDPKSVLYQGAVGMGVGGALSIPAHAADKLSQRKTYDQPPPGAPFKSTHLAGGGVAVQQATRNGKPVPNTYVAQDGSIIKDTAAIKAPELVPSAFDPGPLDADSQMEAIKAEVFQGKYGEPERGARGVAPEPYTGAVEYQPTGIVGAAMGRADQMTLAPREQEPLETIDYEYTPVPEPVQQPQREWVEPGQQIEFEPEQADAVLAQAKREAAKDRTAERMGIRAGTELPTVSPAELDVKTQEKRIKELEREAKRLSKPVGTSILWYLAKNGGLDADMWAAEGLDPADMRAASKLGMPFGQPLFKKGTGRGPDWAREQLSELGIQGFQPGETYEADAMGANSALKLIGDIVRGQREQMYIPGDESADMQRKSDLARIEQLLEQSYSRLNEAQEYDRLSAEEGQEAADRFFYDQRAAEYYESAGEPTWQGKPITADTVLDEQGEKLAALLDQAAAIDEARAESTLERLSIRGATDAELALAMQSIIKGAKDAKTTAKETAKPARPGVPETAPTTQAEEQEKLDTFKRDLEAIGMDETDAELINELAGYEEPEITPATEIDEAAHEAATSPKNDKVATEGQKEAGTYEKGHKVIQGFDISIENPAGSKRRPEWPTLKHHYGYFKRSIGADSVANPKPHQVEHVDAIIKKGVDIADDAPIWVIDQYIDGKFDEHKVVLGPDSEQDARDVYQSMHEKGWDGLHAITQTTAEEVREWIEQVRENNALRKVEFAKRGTAPAESPDVMPEEPETTTQKMERELKAKKDPRETPAKKPKTVTKVIEPKSEDLFAEPEAPAPVAEETRQPTNYARYEGLDISYEVETADTGETFTVTIDAAVALREVDGRLEALRKLKDCI